MYTLVLPNGVKIELTFALRAVVSEIQAHFKNCHIWPWNLAIGESSSNSTYALFLRHRVETELIFCSVGSSFRVMGLFQNCHIWAWNLVIGQSARSCTYSPEVAHILSFYNRSRNWGYFHSTGSGFRDKGHFSKLPYLGMKFGHWPNARSCTYSLSTSGVVIEVIFTLRAAVSEILGNFVNCHIWAWNMGIEQIPRSCTYTVFLPRGRKLSL